MNLLSTMNNIMYPNRIVNKHSIFKPIVIEQYTQRGIPVNQLGGAWQCTLHIVFTYLQLQVLRLATLILKLTFSANSFTITLKQHSIQFGHLFQNIDVVRIFMIDFFNTSLLCFVFSARVYCNNCRYDFSAMLSNSLAIDQVNRPPSKLATHMLMLYLQACDNY